ncbi:endonuclease III [Pisciglobus halotolerans]|uniref:Endonuclease III n=1 Tax=Pisciglobus halotolerans TaxID=745365 RepID=A0A1I3CHF5_9LACT|nr:endonuclease III [Pisciglobus halotolerans]SFH73531.1 DNA-(apurinic or apyrimidinic site) lyase /endonuclease III [Pisciglobus halotolerans]
MLSKKATVEVIEAMGDIFPDAHCELVHKNPFELLVAVMLSAQTTDAAVNKVTPDLFESYPTPESLMQAPLESIMEKIKTIGLYRNKAKYIKGTAEKIVLNFDGEVPKTREELITLPGVGRKSANVVISVAFGISAIAVDTHVERVTKRLGICAQHATVKEVEETLMKKLPAELWGKAHHRLIFFGRYQCPARQHNHEACLALLRAHMASPELLDKAKK